ncbi:MAG: hypothetical protein R2761_24110 [Acidimicrobiales bacterium]
MSEHPTGRSVTTDRTVERYLGAVADHLTVLGVPADRSGQHLAEMAAHLGDSGADPWAEYGTPERYARSLAEADGLRVRPLGPPAVAAAVAGVTLAIGLTLLVRGGRPTELHWAAIASVAPFAAIAGFSATVWGARIRDARLPGSPDGARAARLLVAWIGVVAVGAAVVNAVAEAVLGERRTVWPDVPSWATGLALLSVGGLALALVSRLPRFPGGSGLRGSRIARRIRLP